MYVITSILVHVVNPRGYGSVMPVSTPQAHITHEHIKQGGLACDFIDIVSAEITPSVFAAIPQVYEKTIQVVVQIAETHFTGVTFHHTITLEGTHPCEMHVGRDERTMIPDGYAFTVMSITTAKGQKKESNIVVSHGATHNNQTMVFTPTSVLTAALNAERHDESVYDLSHLSQQYVAPASHLVPHYVASQIFNSYARAQQTFDQASVATALSIAAKPNTTSAVVGWLCPYYSYGTTTWGHVTGLAGPNWHTMAKLTRGDDRLVSDPYEMDSWETNSGTAQIAYNIIQRIRAFMMNTNITSLSIAIAPIANEIGDVVPNVMPLLENASLSTAGNVSAAWNTVLSALAPSLHDLLISGYGSFSYLLSFRITVGHYGYISLSLDGSVSETYHTNDFAIGYTTALEVSNAHLCNSLAPTLTSVAGLLLNQGGNHV